MRNGKRAISRIRGAQSGMPALKLTKVGLVSTFRLFSSPDLNIINSRGVFVNLPPARFDVY
jgi:hypothetical protein